LEAALVRELKETWKGINWTYFRGGLRLPTLQLVESESRLGAWHGGTRVLEISRNLVLRSPWPAVVEVLKHEVAHQYVQEVLGVTDETAHGPAFRKVCDRLGIDAAASGMPTTRSEAPEALDAAGTSPQNRIVERISQLLALAESNNPHEAEAAMAAAQRLMLKYNLERPAQGDQRRYGTRTLGEPKGRVSESERMVAMILGKFFFVEVIWVPAYRPWDQTRGSLLEICGTEENLAMADYVYGFLTHAAENLWQRHQREHGIRSNRDRRVFLSGVMSGFAEKLAKQNVQDAKAGLVWVKDGNLETFFRQRHPHVRHVRHEGQRKNEAYVEGREAGKRLVLRKAVEAAATSGGKALPPRQG
jgi:hypothetical protein